MTIEKPHVIQEINLTECIGNEIQLKSVVQRGKDMKHIVLIIAIDIILLVAAVLSTVVVVMLQGRCHESLVQ